MAVQFITVGEESRSPTVLNRALGDVLEQSSYNRNGTDFVGFARILDAEVSVANSAARDVRFPSSSVVVGQRVYREDTQVVERWNGLSWDTIFHKPERIFARWYGVKADSLTDDAAAIRLAVAAADAKPNGAIIEFPAGQIIMNTSVALTPKVSIQGQGIERTIFSCPLGQGGFVLQTTHFNTNVGEFKDFQMSGPAVFPGTLTSGQQTAALTSIGFDLLYCANAYFERVLISNFGTNLRCRDWDHVHFVACRFGGYRKAGGASVMCGDQSIPHAADPGGAWGAYAGSSSNGLFFKDCWVSCGGGVQGFRNDGAAVQIDRFTMLQVIGGTYESGGVGFKLAATTTGADGFRSSDALFRGVDCENCIGQYLEVGTLEATASPALSGLSLNNVNGSTAGSTNTTRGAVLRNVRGFEARGHSLALAGAGVAYWDFVGANNHPNVDIDIAANYALAGGSYLRVNGTVVAGSVDERIIGLPGYSTDVRAVVRMPSLTAERVTPGELGSIRGSASFASGVAQSIFAPGASNGQYLITVNGIGAGSANYQARAWFVSTNIYNALYDILSGSANLVISNSGGNVSVTQSSGAPMTLEWTITHFH